MVRLILSVVMRKCFFLADVTGTRPKSQKQPGTPFRSFFLRNVYDTHPTFQPQVKNAMLVPLSFMNLYVVHGLNECFPQTAAPACSYDAAYSRKLVAYASYKLHKKCSTVIVTKCLLSLVEYLAPKVITNYRSLITCNQLLHRSDCHNEPCVIVSK